MQYKVVAVGVAREVYVVEASSPQEAQEQVWEKGALLNYESESMEIASVSEFE